LSVELSEMPAPRAIAAFSTLTDSGNRGLFLDVGNVDALNKYEGDAQAGSNDPGVRGEPATDDSSDGKGSAF
jgi:hypothetical protein